jgi:hypothetical protein
VASQNPQQGSEIVEAQSNGWDNNQAPAPWFHQCAIRRRLQRVFARPNRLVILGATRDTKLSALSPP